MGASLSWGDSFAKAWGVSFGRGTTPPPEGGGGGGSAEKGTGKRKGWVREREIFEASQLSRQAQNDKQIEVIEELNAPTAPQVSYDAELQKLADLRKQLANLQIDYNSQQDQAQDRQQAAIELSNFINDEEDAIAALMALQEYEARLLITVLVVKVAEST